MWSGATTETVLSWCWGELPGATGTAAYPPLQSPNKSPDPSPKLDQTAFYIFHVSWPGRLQPEQEQEKKKKKPNKKNHFSNTGASILWTVVKTCLCEVSVNRNSHHTSKLAGAKRSLGVSKAVVPTTGSRTEDETHRATTYFALPGNLARWSINGTARKLWTGDPNCRRKGTGRFTWV